jgi:hypothetical protein
VSVEGMGSIGTRGSEPKEVVVVTKDNPSFRLAVCELVLINCPEEPTSELVVTSMPRRRSPAAIACEQFSSRGMRIVRGIGLPCP